MERESLRFSGVSCALPGASPLTVIYNDLSDLRFYSPSYGYDGGVNSFPLIRNHGRLPNGSGQIGSVAAGVTHHDYAVEVVHNNIIHRVHEDLRYIGDPSSCFPLEKISVVELEAYLRLRTLSRQIGDHISA